MTIPASLVLSPGTINNPYPFYRRLQNEAPVWRVPGTDIFFVTSYSLVDEASRRVSDFSSHIRGVLYKDDDGLPAVLSYNDASHDVLATADPPDHAIHKNAVFPSLVSKKMTNMELEVEEIACDVLNQALLRLDVEFMSDVAFKIPVEVVIKLVGFQGSQFGALLQLALDSSAMVGGALKLDQLLDLVERNKGIFEWLADQLRTENPEKESILAACKMAVASGELSFDAAKGILHILLAAAGESTSSLMGNATRILAENPALQEHLRTQTADIPQFVEEVLRLESPFRAHLRSVPSDTHLGGIDIPKGATVLLFWAASNRDPEVFENPDQIKLDRPRRHIAFGRGIHTCVGAPLARLEAKILIRELLERTSSFAIAPNESPRWADSLQIRRHDYLPIRWSPR